MHLPRKLLLIAAMLTICGSANAQSVQSIFIDLPKDWISAPDEISLPEAWYQQMVAAVEQTNISGLEQGGCLYVGALEPMDDELLPHRAWRNERRENRPESEWIPEVAALITAYDAKRYTALSDDPLFSATPPSRVENDAFRIESECVRNYQYLGSFHTHPSVTDVVGLSPGDLRAQNWEMSFGASVVGMASALPGTPTIIAVKTQEWSEEQALHPFPLEHVTRLANFHANLAVLNRARFAGTPGADDMWTTEFFTDSQNYAEYILKFIQDRYDNGFVYYLGTNNKLVKLGSVAKPWPHSYTGDMMDNLGVPHEYWPAGNIFAQLLAPFDVTMANDDPARFEAAVDEMISGFHSQARRGHLDTDDPSWLLSSPKTFPDYRDVSPGDTVACVSGQNISNSILPKSDFDITFSPKCTLLTDATVDPILVPRSVVLGYTAGHPTSLTVRTAGKCFTWYGITGDADFAMLKSGCYDDLAMVTPPTNAP